MIKPWRVLKKTETEDGLLLTVSVVHQAVKQDDVNETFVNETTVIVQEGENEDEVIFAEICKQGWLE